MFNVIFLNYFLLFFNGREALLMNFCSRSNRHVDHLSMRLLLLFFLARLIGLMISYLPGISECWFAGLLLRFKLFKSLLGLLFPLLLQILLIPLFFLRLTVSLIRVFLIRVVTVTTLAALIPLMSFVLVGLRFA